MFFNIFRVNNEYNEYSLRKEIHVCLYTVCLFNNNKEKFNPDWLVMALKMSDMYIFMFLFIWIQFSLCWRRSNSIALSCNRLNEDFTLIFILINCSCQHFCSIIVCELILFIQIYWTNPISFIMTYLYLYFLYLTISRSYRHCSTIASADEILVPILRFHSLRKVLFLKVFLCQNYIILF